MPIMILFIYNQIPELEIYKDTFLLLYILNVFFLGNPFTSTNQVFISPSKYPLNAPYKCL